MAQTKEAAARVINGTWGELWINGIKVAECTAFQLKVAKSKEAVNLCGDMVEYSKTTKVKITGSMTLYKVDSGTLEQEGAILEGRDSYFSVVAKVADPDALGAERVSATGINFDDMTLADWKAAAVGTVTRPFTATGWRFLDTIPAG